MNRPASQPNPLTWVWNAFPKTLECFSDCKREGGGVGLMLSSRRTRSPAEGESLTILTGPHLRQCFCLLALWLWTLANGIVCILYTFYTVSIDKFLRRKIPFLHLYSKTIEDIYENTNDAKGLSFVECTVLPRILWHWYLYQHVICEIKWIFLQLNDCPLGRVLVQQSHYQMVFMGYLCKW